MTRSPFASASSLPRASIQAIQGGDIASHAITAARAYKLILKSIARLAGLRSPDACVLSFPRSLEELDQKSSEFCANDRAALVGAGILKDKEDRRGTDCDAVAQRPPTGMLVAARGMAGP
jgi:hypothetical protein